MKLAMTLVFVSVTFMLMFGFYKVASAPYEYSSKKIVRKTVLELGGIK